MFICKGGPWETTICISISTGMLHITYCSTFYLSLSYLLEYGIGIVLESGRVRTPVRCILVSRGI